MNKPETKFRCGNTTATIWRNTKKINGQDVDMHSVTIEKSYKDGEEWKTTSSFSVNDLPKVRLVSDLAYEYVMMQNKD